VAVDAYHNILRLEVAEDDVLCVDVLERQRELGRVDHRLPFYNEYDLSHGYTRKSTLASMEWHFTAAAEDSEPSPGRSSGVRRAASNADTRAS
jgi:hypothetical protein